MPLLLCTVLCQYGTSLAGKNRAVARRLFTVLWAPAPDVLSVLWRTHGRQAFLFVLDMIASEPHWFGHMTSNLSLPLDRLLNTPLVRSGRLFVNALSIQPRHARMIFFKTAAASLRRHRSAGGIRDVSAPDERCFR